MNIEQYKIEIQRTWQDDMSQWEQLSNAALGLVGEVAEYEHSRTIGELGDVAYYAYTLSRLMGHEPRALSFIDKRPMLTTAALIAECIKKIAYHDLDQMAQSYTTEDLNIYLDSIMHAIKSRCVCEFTGRDFFGEVLAANIAKLRARYPDGFVSGGGVR